MNCSDYYKKYPILRPEFERNFMLKTYLEYTPCDCSNMDMMFGDDVAKLVADCFCENLEDWKYKIRRFLSVDNPLIITSEDWLKISTVINFDNEEFVLFKKIAFVLGEKPIRQLDVDLRKDDFKWS